MHRKGGFTLVELSIVLVIIGLIVGGVLVGRDLIGASQVRATISQLEKYRTATNTFRLKYGFLPGDIPDPQASSFGFISRGSFAGQGDGNGFLEGSWANTINYNRTSFLDGELNVYWRDLSAAGLIDGNFITATSANRYPTPGAVNPNDYMPFSKLGNGSYVLAYSPHVVVGAQLKSSGTHYFGIQMVSYVTPNGDFSSTLPMAMSPVQAYGIDSKVDDGAPQTGSVTARYYIPYSLTWSSGTSISGGVGASDTSATAPSSATCYDNGSATGVAQSYTLGQNGGNGMNCSLLIKAGF